MVESNARERARLRRRPLIERLNAKEAELSEPRAGRPQLSEGQLEAEIERQRMLNLIRAIVPPISY